MNIIKMHLLMKNNVFVRIVILNPVHRDVMSCCVIFSDKQGIISLVFVVLAQCVRYVIDRRV